MRLISKKSVFRILQEEPSYYDTQNAITEIYDKINELPTIEERKTGKWIKDDGNGFLCSVCNNGYKNQPTCMGKPMFTFCPCCGAKMNEAYEEK